MRIPLDHESEHPLYRQIKWFLYDAIVAGRLAPGTRLPATRELARDLGVSRVTVETAYAILEADGLVERRTGSGSYVSDLTLAHTQPTAQGDWPLWQYDLPTDDASADGLRPDSTATMRHPRPIRFTGFGDPRRFPVSDFARSLKAVLQHEGSTALALGDIQGYAPLRATVAQVLASQGIAARPETTLITSGSQQAIALVARLLLKPGASVLVEQPTYDLALELFRSHGLKIVGCPVDADGMQVDHLEPLLQKYHPSLIYTIPNFQNPTGACLSLARRRQLITLADRYNVPILEDDFVGDLRYDGHALPALKALDPGGRVIYIGTFSKMLMPGLRIGFMVVDGPLFECLVSTKHVTDLATSLLTQRALERYVTVGRYQAHLRRSCQEYRRRRDAMVAALDRHFPAGTGVDTPVGGIFLWVRLPDGISTTALRPLALAEGVDFARGSRFFADRTQGDAYMRLNFAVHTPDEIGEGIARLGRVLRQR